MITQAGLKDALHYNPLTGVFTWRATKARITAGDVAGTLNKGYVMIKLHQKIYSAHRLAWLYTEGYIPVEVDHDNHARADNRWENLNASDRPANCVNQSLNTRNTSGFNGVNWHVPAKKWCARIHTQGRTSHLGLFKKKSDAIAARKAANIKFGFHPNHGQFTANNDNVKGKA